MDHFPRRAGKPGATAGKDACRYQPKIVFLTPKRIRATIAKEAGQEMPIKKRPPPEKEPRGKPR